MRWKFVTWLTVQATNLSNIILKSRRWNFDLKDFETMPECSLGYQLQLYLKRNFIEFKPNLIRHDIKHILLGYEMKMPDELKIHAFLLGNKSYNSLGMIYLLVCILIVPEIIPKLVSENKRGKNADCLHAIILQDYLTQDINSLRQKFNIF